MVVQNMQNDLIWSAQ